jgi:hypothetical protein
LLRAAQKVCEEHKLALLDPEKLVQAAVAEAEACDPKPPASGEEAPAEAPPPPPEPSEVALLGRRARDALQNEQPVPDDVLVALVVNAMVMLAATVDPPEEGAAPKAAGKGEKPPSAKAKPGSAKGGKDAGAAAPERERPLLPLTTQACPSSTQSAPLLWSPVVCWSAVLEGWSIWSRAPARQGLWCVGLHTLDIAIATPSYGFGSKEESSTCG